MKGPFEVGVRLKISNPGRVGVAWRLDDQKDFSAEQNISANLTKADEFQAVTLKVPLKGKAIHFRLHLPEGESIVEEIVFNGEKGRIWNFKEVTKE